VFRNSTRLGTTHALWERTRVDCRSGAQVLLGGGLSPSPAPLPAVVNPFRNLLRRACSERRLGVGGDVRRSRFRAFFYRRVAYPCQLFLPSIRIRYPCPLSVPSILAACRTFLPVPSLLLVQSLPGASHRRRGRSPFFAAAVQPWSSRVTSNPVVGWPPVLLATTAQGRGGTGCGRNGVVSVDAQGRLVPG